MFEELAGVEDALAVVGLKTLQWSRMVGRVAHAVGRNAQQAGNEGQVMHALVVAAFAAAVADADEGLCCNIQNTK